MSTLNKLVIVSLAFVVLSGQSLINGFGPGRIVHANNASSLGNATTGIIPGFRQGVSLSNPSTWSNLNYSIISTGYSGWETAFGQDGAIAGNSELTMVKMVIPFKSMLSFGVEFKPYSSQFIDITDNDQTFDGTPSALRIISGGGMSSVNFSLGGKFGQFDSYGIELDYIYGSNRKEYALSFDDRTFAKVDKFLYSGVLINFYGHSERLKINKRPVGLYIKTRFALAPVSSEEISLAPYEDLNESGFYDQSFPTLDYPNPLWLGESLTRTVSSVHNPFLIGYGLDYNMNTNITLSHEGVLEFENGKNAEAISVFSDYIDKSSRFSFSVFGHGERNGRNLKDKLYLRSGVFFEQNSLKFSGDTFAEKGLNLGLGIKFGAFNNQIDLGYSLGLRNKSGEMPEEKIQNVSITLSLGDLWFVKRRER